MIKGKKIAAIITDGYHNSELGDPMDALIKEGAEFTLIGMMPQHKTAGVLDHNNYKWPDEIKPKDLLKVSKLINEVNADDYDALLIPGGNGPEAMRVIPEVIRFVQDFFLAGKTIAAICHGPLVLISAEIVKGKAMTCVNKIAIDLKNAGAIYVDRPLVTDGCFVTSRTPADMDAFIKGFKAALK